MVLSPQSAAIQRLDSRSAAEITLAGDTYMATSATTEASSTEPKCNLSRRSSFWAERAIFVAVISDIIARRVHLSVRQNLGYSGVAHHCTPH